MDGESSGFGDESSYYDEEVDGFSSGQDGESSGDEGFMEEFDNLGGGQMSRRRCAPCCPAPTPCGDPCFDEFEEVHCALEDLCIKVCDVQFNQEAQDICLGAIKVDLGTNCDKLIDLQADVTTILTDLTQLIIDSGLGTTPGTTPGTGGPLVCIKMGCGGCCCDPTDCTCGTVPCTCCCCDPDCVDPGLPPGAVIPDPDPLCLINDGVTIAHGDLVELWFEAKTRSCSREYYLGSPSINWSIDFGCNDLTGFHGEADLFPPGETEVTQATFYVKRNSAIPGLLDATKWVYDTSQVELVNADLLLLDLGLQFEGGQLVDSQGLCLTRPEFSIPSTDPIPVP